MRNTKINRKSQRGHTVFEVVAVFSVVAIIGAAVFVFASSMFRDSKVEQAYQTMLEIETKVRAAYQNRVNYAGLNGPNIGNSGLLSENIVHPTTRRPMTPFGELYVMPISLGCAGCNNGIAFVFRGLPPDACLKLATREYGDKISRILVAEDSSSSYQDVLGNPTLASTRCNLGNEARVRIDLKG